MCVRTKNSSDFTWLTGADYGFNTGENLVRIMEVF
jgi:hypothetical protein